MASYSSIEMKITEKGMAGPLRDRQTCSPQWLGFSEFYFLSGSICGGNSYSLITNVSPSKSQFHD